MRVDGSRIRKEKFADSKISGYVWTGPKLILEISKYQLPLRYCTPIRNCVNYDIIS